MKMYKVNVNGTEYEITLEVVDAADVKPAAPAPAAAPAPVAEAAPAPAAAPAAAGGETVVAPMPGTILSVNVANGAAVKKGDVLLVLEAMKMENEIMAPCDGTVSSVPATKGATVNTGDVLCVIA
ncbi:MAG: biotin/lipoyl-binding protein [Clostridia bacterium]|nr:biotin/lipoyl-binding protein [Clostridia bacterium]